MTDNAFAYTRSRAFQAALRAIGARHLTTRPCPTSQARTEAMPDRLHTCNRHRPTPASRARRPCKG